MAKNEEAPRRRGRPPVAAEDRKRHTLSFRLTDKVKDALQARAEANGRSLSEEVELIVQVELFIDMNLLHEMGEDFDSSLAHVHNQKIKTINECIVFQNILSRLFRDINNLSLSAENLQLHAYIQAYNELYDFARSAIREVEYIALEEMNNLVMKFVTRKLESNTNLSDEEKRSLQSDFLKARTDTQKFLSAVFKDRGIKI